MKLKLIQHRDSTNLFYIHKEIFPSEGNNFISVKFFYNFIEIRYTLRWRGEWTFLCLFKVITFLNEQIQKNSHKCLQAIMHRAVYEKI